MLPDQNSLLQDLTFDNVNTVAEQIMTSFTSLEFDRVELIYNKFKNAAVQNLTNEVFLPVETFPESQVENHSDRLYL